MYKLLAFDDNHLLEEFDDVFVAVLSMVERFNKSRELCVLALDGGDGRVRKLFDPSVLGMSSVTHAAFLLAMFYHRKQKRKGDGRAYFEHPMEVAYTLFLRGYESDTVAAALGHDLIEDTVCLPSEISNLCGEEVLRVIEACSNDESLGGKEFWKEKRVKYISTVCAGGRSAMAVAVSDKICNLRSFIAQYLIIGDDLWRRFHADRSLKMWFEEAFFEAVVSAGFDDSVLLNEYRALIVEFDNLTGK